MCAAATAAGREAAMLQNQSCMGMCRILNRLVMASEFLVTYGPTRLQIPFSRTVEVHETTAASGTWLHNLGNCWGPCCNVSIKAPAVRACGVSFKEFEASFGRASVGAFGASVLDALHGDRFVQIFNLPEGNACHTMLLCDLLQPVYHVSLQALGGQRQNDLVGRNAGAEPLLDRLPRVATARVAFGDRPVAILHAAAMDHYGKVVDGVLDARHHPRPRLGLSRRISMTLEPNNPASSEPRPGIWVALCRELGFFCIVLGFLLVLFLVLCCFWQFESTPIICGHLAASRRRLASRTAISGQIMGARQSLGL